MKYLQYILCSLALLSQVCVTFIAQNLGRLQLWILSTFIVITYTKWQRASHSKSRLSSLKLISKAVIYFNYDYLSVEPAAQHTALSPWPASERDRHIDSQRKRGRDRGREKERRSMAAVGQLIVLHFPPITVQLFFLSLSLTLPILLMICAELLRF